VVTAIRRAQRSLFSDADGKPRHCRHAVRRIPEALITVAN
jgi:hypothetical protein